MALTRSKTRSPFKAEAEEVRRAVFLPNDDWAGQAAGPP